MLRDAGAAGALLAAGGIAAACGPATTTPTPTPRATALPAPETTTLKIFAKPPPTCEAPIWLLNDLLREEGFTDVANTPGGIATGESDFGVTYGNFFVSGVEAKFPWVALAGCHTGCIELWAAPGIASIGDLRGKTMDVWDKVTGPRPDLRATGIFYGFLLSMLSQIGMDPAEMRLNEVAPTVDTDERYLSGETDAVMTAIHGGPLMRRNPRKRGQVIIDTAVDRPWSQYYCCLLVANRDWARSNPVATKRVTRAFLRGSDLVMADKKAAVQKALSSGIYAGTRVPQDEAILFETIEMLSYAWREYDPEETMRFFAQRLSDVKQLQSSPQQIVEAGTDFAYMRQLAKELKP